MSWLLIFTSLNIFEWFDLITNLLVLGACGHIVYLLLRIKNARANPGHSRISEDYIIARLSCGNCPHFKEYYGEDRSKIGHLGSRGK